MKIKILKENKDNRATTKDFEKLLKLAKKKDIETDNMILVMLESWIEEGPLYDDETDSAALEVYYHYNSRRVKAEEYVKKYDADLMFWKQRNKGSSQTFSGMVRKTEDKLNEWKEVLNVANQIFEIYRIQLEDRAKRWKKVKTKLSEEKSYIEPFKKKSSYATRWLIAVLEDEMTGEVREVKVEVPLQMLQDAEEETKHLPVALQGEAFDNFLTDHLFEFMSAYDMIGWEEALIDYRPGNPSDSFDINPKPKPYVKDSEFDQLEEAKEDDVKEKYGLQDGEHTDGKTYPHFSYRLMVQWVQDNRAKRLKYLDWMAKQIAGSEWNDQNALRTTLEDILPAIKNFAKYGSQFKEKEISAYENPEALMAAYKKDVTDPLIAKVRKKRRMPSEEHGDVIYQDDRFFVVHPKTVEASCYYGAKTKWCISQADNPHFKTYADAGKVFYMIRDDTKKNNHDFYALTVQMRKPSGKVEALWDRYDEKYGPDEWPDAYGEEIEEPIMSAIKAHFKKNYGTEDTIPLFVAAINKGKYNRKIDFEGGMLYLKWKAKLQGGDSGGYFMSYHADYIIEYKDKLAMPKKRMGKTWRIYTDEMLNNAFEASKEQIISKTAKTAIGFKGMNVEYNGSGDSEPGQILLYFSMPGRETANVDTVQYFVSHLSSVENLQETSFDVLDEFLEQWNHFMKKELKNQMAQSVTENKKRLKVRIK